MYASIILLSIVFIIIISGFLFKAYDFKGESMISKMSHFAHPGAAILLKIYDFVRGKIVPWNEELIDDYYSKIYIGQDKEKIKKEDRLRPALYALYAIIVSSVIGIVLALFTSDHERIDVLKRPEYGEEKINIMSTYKDEEIPLQISLESAIPDKKVMEARVKEAIDELPDYILGNNKSLDHITDNLKLVSSYKNLSTRVVWISSNGKILDNTGQINRDSIYEDTTVFLTMQVKSFDYLEEKELKLTIKAQKGLVSDKAYLTEYVNDYLNSDKGKEKVELPYFIGDEEVVFYTPKDDRVRIVLLLGIIISVCMIFYGASKRREKINKREKELVNDFEEFAAKLLLYGECGYGVSASFEKIAGDYEKRRLKRRYVYEEMVKTCNEIKNGKELSSSYEDFGRRCGNIFYIRLGSLLSRQLLRGGDVFTISLQKEITEARREKQAAIRKKGEEASIKLLGPMCGMFIIVLAIVVIPAFMNM